MTEMCAHVDLYTHVCMFADVDECASSPCVNAVNCTNAIGSFTCDCEDGFTGVLCDSGNIWMLSI